MTSTAAAVTAIHGHSRRRATAAAAGDDPAPNLRARPPAPPLRRPCADSAAPDLSQASRDNLYEIGGKRGDDAADGTRSSPRILAMVGHCDEPSNARCPVNSS